MKRQFAAFEHFVAEMRTIEGLEDFRAWVIVKEGVSNARIVTMIDTGTLPVMPDTPVADVVGFYGLGARCRYLLFDRRGALVPIENAGAKQYQDNPAALKPFVLAAR